jgi:hypothetical protein
MPLAIKGVATDYSMPTHSAGDLLLAIQHSSNAAFPAEWTSIASAATTWNYDAYRVGYRIATASNTVPTTNTTGQSTRTYSITGFKESAPIAAFGTQQYAAWSNPVACIAPSIDVPGASGTTNGSAFFMASYNGYGPTVPAVTTPKVAATTLASGDFTMECWIKPRTIPAGGAYSAIYADRNGNDFTGFHLYLTGHSTGNGNVGVVAGDGSGWQVLSLPTTSGGITAGSWSHVAITRSGSTFRTFVNGVVQATITASISLAQGTTSRIGLDAGGAAGTFDGYMSNFRIVKGTALYTSNFTPSGPLTAVSGTGLLTFTSPTVVTDSSGNNLTLTAPTPSAGSTTHSILPNGDSPFSSLNDALRFTLFVGYGAGGNPPALNNGLTVGGPGMSVVSSGGYHAIIEGGGAGPIYNMGSPGASYGGGRAIVTVSINPAPSSGFFSMF